MTTHHTGFALGLAGLDPLDADIGIAASSDGCVLITGDAGVASDIARLIVRRRLGSATAMSVVDCAAAHPSRLRTDLREAVHGVFLPEVHLLTPACQAELTDLIDSHRGNGSSKVIASCSARLYDRMTGGLFLPDLFYRLNTIHLVTSVYPGEHPSAGPDLPANVRHRVSPMIRT